jgi:translocation and assembly module TamB
VEGEVTIPQAYLSPPGGTDGGVPVSDDVVIVDDTDEDQEQIEGFQVFTRVRVILGKDVQVEAGGFKGNIEGNLMVEQTPRLAPRGTGTIQVQTGQYRVYGQELEIQRGRILFVGPIDNPGLDLQVAREVDEVTAGARVGGTVKTPELSLFSDPAMPDSSILSYLLFGRPPQARGGTESELLLKAALALGLSGGNLVTQRLTDAFGLDYLRFETGDEPSEAALVIGKYLSPNLYVSYGIGVFEAVSTFNLRYDITERLSLESITTDEASGADLIFTIER